MSKEPNESRNVQKYSVSMPADIAEKVRQRVGKGRFSAYVTAAVEQQIRRDQLEELADYLLENSEPIPESIQAEVAREFAAAEQGEDAWLEPQQSPTAKAA